jgi:serine/threonine-protein kinase RsbT
MRFEDKGPGIPELDPAVAASHSTATPGLGLYGSRRLVDEFALDSRIDHGTTVTVTKWARF